MDGDDGLLEDHAGPLWHCHVVVRRFWRGMNGEFRSRTQRKHVANSKSSPNEGTKGKVKKVDKCPLPQRRRSKEKVQER